MHNLKTNFDKIFDIAKSFFCDSLNGDDNFFFYPRKPKMSDCEIITLSIVGESIGIDSENYLFGKLKSDHSHDFPHLIDRSNFNRRRRRLGDYIVRLNKQVADLMNQGENIFLFVESCGKSQVKSAGRILKQPPTKVTLPSTKPGILDTSSTWLLQSMACFPLWK